MKSKVAVMLALGCGMACGRDDYSTTPPIIPFLVTISPPRLQVVVGDSVDFSVQVTEAMPGQPSAPLTCRANDPNMASVRTLLSSCRAYALQPGQTTVTAAIGTASVSASLTITPRVEIALVAPRPHTGMSFR